MEKWIYLGITLGFYRSDQHNLESILVYGKRVEPPMGVQTRGQALEHDAKLGWTCVKSYSDVYTLKHAVRK